MTPTMEAKIATSFLTFEDVIAQIDSANPPPVRGPRGPCKKKIGT